nr:MAG TPA: hypothetical protein [Caudoviricetes sp.]
MNVVQPIKKIEDIQKIKKYLAKNREMFCFLVSG